MPAPAENTADDHTQTRTFIDLDGVLADFDLHATNEGKYTADGKVKWDELDYQWWITMPPCEGAKEFLDIAKKLSIVKFLTAPVPYTASFTGKADWIQAFIPERGRFALLDLIICRGKDKNFLAKPNHILIDDREKNIQEWVAAGGIGIHHKGDFVQTLKELQ
jgi:hypothetical protein